MSLFPDILIPFMSSSLHSVIIIFMYVLNEVVKWGSLIELHGFNHNLYFHFWFQFIFRILLFLPCVNQNYSIAQCSLTIWSSDPD
jgi:hypothetical protein